MSDSWTGALVSEAYILIAGQKGVQAVPEGKARRLDNNGVPSQTVDTTLACTKFYVIRYAPGPRPLVPSTCS